MPVLGEHRSSKKLHFLGKKNILLLLLGAFILYIAFHTISICRYSNEYSERECDVAIVLGAACSNTEVSEVYKQRLNHAVVLFQNGKIKKIITTGGIGQGNTIPDADIAKK